MWNVEQRILVPAISLRSCCCSLHSGLSAVKLMSYSGMRLIEPRHDKDISAKHTREYIWEWWLYYIIYLINYHIMSYNTFIVKQPSHRMWIYIVSGFLFLCVCTSTYNSSNAYSRMWYQTIFVDIVWLISKQMYPVQMQIASACFL